jgi:hypothetical protein
MRAQDRAQHGSTKGWRPAAVRWRVRTKVAINIHESSGIDDLRIHERSTSLSNTTSIRMESVELHSSKSTSKSDPQEPVASLMDPSASTNPQDGQSSDRHSALAKRRSERTRLSK